MSTFAVHAEHLVLPEGVVCSGYLAIEDGRFADVCNERPACDVVEYGDAWVAPGLVDTHIHGFADHDVMDCDPAGIDAMCEALARRGTTSILATTLTASLEQTREACAAVAAAAGGRADDFLGARIQGIFLEGPFFTEKYKGAQNPKYLCDPSLDALDLWQEAAGGRIRKSALAPERDGSVDYVRGCGERDVVAAIGHTNACYEQARAAVDAGASVFVHTYNAMSPLTHRAPGTVGCAMTSDDAASELICDGLHVSPVACDALVRAKGWEHVFLISDCLRCGGMPEGDYMLGELPIRLSGGVARLRDEGNIAGSVLTMAGAIKNVVDWGIVDAEQAIRMATEIPARTNGIDATCGSIRPGRLADLVILGSDLSLEATYLGGVLL